MTYHHGNLRHALIVAGAELIEAKGVAEISLRAVAKQAGVSHSAPYRHFKDKNALLAGITEVGFSQLDEAMKQAVIDNPQAPREQLIAAGVAYIDLAIRYKQMHNLMFGGSWQFCDNSDKLKQVSNSAFEGLVKIIKNGQQLELYKKGDAEVLALTAWSLVHGYAMLASTGQLSHLAESDEKILALAKMVELNLINGLLA